MGVDTSSGPYLSPTSPDNNGYIHSNSDALDEILSDFPENTSAAPKAEMEGDTLSDEDSSISKNLKLEEPLPLTEFKDDLSPTKTLKLEDMSPIEESSSTNIDDGQMKRPSVDQSPTRFPENEVHSGMCSDYVQQKVFTVHFNLSASMVNITTPTAENDQEGAITFIDTEELSFDHHGSNGSTIAEDDAARLDDNSNDRLESDVVDRSETDEQFKDLVLLAGIEGRGCDDLKDAIILSSRVDGTSAADQDSGMDDMMYIYEVVQCSTSDPDGSESDPVDRVHTTRVFLKFSGQTINGHIEREGGFVASSPMKTSSKEQYFEDPGSPVASQAVSLDNSFKHGMHPCLFPNCMTHERMKFLSELLEIQ